MEQERSSWPIAVGIGAGMLVGIIAAIYLYSDKTQTADTKLRDAKDIIDQCRNQIREIEQNLAALREPIAP